MSAAGTDVAPETADIALMADDLTRLAPDDAPLRNALVLVRRNTTLSIVVRAVYFVLAGGGWAMLD